MAEGDPLPQGQEAHVSWPGGPGAFLLDPDILGKGL